MKLTHATSMQSGTTQISISKGHDTDTYTDTGTSKGTDTDDNYVKEGFDATSTTAPVITKYNPPKEIHKVLDSKYNSIISSQYVNFKTQQQLDKLTDKMNKINSDLQKQINSSLTYQASGDITFY